MSLFSSSRSILILGDEGLFIYKVSGGTSSFVRFVEWAKASFEADVKQILIKECGKKPALIINDMVEQHYRKEELPKISALDKSSVVKRRLSIAFPNYPIRAALKLKVPKGQKVVQGGTFLFAAMPQSDAYKKTMAAVRASGAGLVGLNLLPVEGSAMVRSLSQKFVKKDEPLAKWSIFVGQHHGGGLRQVVTRDGELALTRMTPIVDTDVEPDFWVKEISSELQSTMSYLGRFGYKPADGLDIFIVCGDDTKELLRRTINIDANLMCLTAPEVASSLGVNVNQQDDSRYADPVYAAWLASQRSFVLPMQNPDIDKEVLPRRIAMFASFLLLGAVAFTGFQSFQGWRALEESKSKFALLQQEKQNLQIEYDKTLSETKIPGYDLLLVNNAIATYQELPSTNMGTLELIKILGDALSNNLKLSDMSLRAEVPPETGIANFNTFDDGSSNKKTSFFNVLTKIKFDKNVDTESAIWAIDNFKSRLEQKLPGFEVNIIKQVGNLSYTGSIVGETRTRIRGEIEEQQEKQDFSAELTIVEKRP